MRFGNISFASSGSAERENPLASLALSVDDDTAAEARFSLDPLTSKGVKSRIGGDCGSGGADSPAPVLLCNAGANVRALAWLPSGGWVGNVEHLAVGTTDSHGVGYEAHGGTNGIQLWEVSPRTGAAEAWLLLMHAGGGVLDLVRAWPGRLPWLCEGGQ